MKGYAAAIKGKISGETWNDADGEVWSFKVHEYGDMGGGECAKVGSEFNPLTEYVYGQLNPYADLSRGTINDVTIIDTPDGSTDTEQEFKQGVFMQNLAGKNSIIGKSIKVTRTV